MIKVEEAAEKWRKTYCPNAPSVYDAFIAGAKWQEEQSKCETFDNLEEELKEWMEYGPHTNFPWCTIPDAIEITARHFADWQKEQDKETIEVAEDHAMFAGMNMVLDNPEKYGLQKINKDGTLQNS